MIDLRQQDHDALRDVVRAGSRGLTLAEVGCGSALMLALLGLAQITAETPQRVLATRQGSAFARRVVA